MTGGREVGGRETERGRRAKKDGKRSLPRGHLGVSSILGGEEGHWEPEASGGTGAGLQAGVGIARCWDLAEEPSWGSALGNLWSPAQ